MIQECGNFILPAQHSGRYHYVVVEHAGAYNCRCNTCIIADLNFVASIHYLISGTGRSAICLNYNGCIYNHRTTKTNQKYPSVNL